MTRINVISLPTDAEAAPSSVRATTALGNKIYPSINALLSDADKYTMMTPAKFAEMGIDKDYAECEGDSMDSVTFMFTWPDGSSLKVSRLFYLGGHLSPAAETLVVFDGEKVTSHVCYLRNDLASIYDRNQLDKAYQNPNTAITHELVKLVCDIGRLDWEDFTKASKGSLEFKDFLTRTSAMDIQNFCLRSDVKKQVQNLVHSFNIDTRGRSIKHLTLIAIQRGLSSIVSTLCRNIFGSVTPANLQKLFDAEVSLPCIGQFVEVNLFGYPSESVYVCHANDKIYLAFGCYDLGDAINQMSAEVGTDVPKENLYVVAINYHVTY